MHDYQAPLGVLVSKLVQKPEVIHELLAGFLQYDDFLAKLVDVSKKYNAYEKKQTIQMCVLRCDFMIDWPNDQPKLVEYNTIASSFGVLSQRVVQVQKYIKDKYDHIKYSFEPLAQDAPFLEF